VSDFGTFVAPNISPDTVHGIGAWTDLDLANAILRGVSPDGAHLFPAFPYPSYQKMTLQDVVDLIAHLRTLPPSDVASQPHDVGFPFNQRRAVGVWKMLFMSPEWALPVAPDDDVARGRYLAEALGHCGECHTPRNALGGMDNSRWLGGAPHPSGEGRIPNITTGALGWSKGEIAEYLKSGFTPDFDTAGGEMAEVVRNTSELTDADRAAIAAYLKAVPPVAPEG
jgi:mono/diheme cytochrome c family protein